MRTTLEIDEGVLRAARALASEKGMSLGAAVSELARRGLSAREPAESSGLPVFSIGADAQPITLELVREANEDQ